MLGDESGDCPRGAPDDTGSWRLEICSGLDATEVGRSELIIIVEEQNNQSLQVSTVSGLA